MNWNVIKWRSLNTRVTLFALAIFVIGIWTLTLYGRGLMQETLQRLLGEHQFSTAGVMGVQINQELEQRMRALKAVAATFSPATLANAATLQANLNERLGLRELFNGGFFVTGIDGVAIAEIPVSNERVGVNYSDRDHMVAALADGKASISKPVMGRKLLAPIFAMTVPIIDNSGKAVGALVAVTDLGKPNFLDFITQSHYGKTGGFLIIARQQRLVVTATDKRRIMEVLPAAGVNPAVDRFMQGHEGTDVFVNQHGVKLLASAKSIPAADWLVAAAMPVEEAYAAFQPMRQRLLLATILLTLLVGILTWLMLRHQISPLLSTVRTLATVSESGRPPARLPITRQDEIGELIGSFNHLLDTLGQREEALQRSDERFRSLTELSSDWYWEQDKELRLSFHSSGFDRSSGTTSRKLLGTYRWDEPNRIPLGMTWDEHRAMLEARLPFRDFEYVRIGDDGECHFASLSGEPIFDAAGNFDGYRGVGRNITERKQAETALHESEERYRTLVEWSPEPVAVHRDGKVIYVNPAAVKTIGASSAQELIGRPLFEFIHPDFHSPVLARMKVIAEGGRNPPMAEVKFLRLDGTTLIAEVRGTSIIFDGAPAMHVAIRDITERIRAEADRSTLEAQLRESQKMQAIGTLAGGIAHDFNNILATILGNADLARQDVGNYPMALESLEEIRKAGSRARDLVQQILSFSRRQPTDRKHTALAPVIEESARLLRATLPARIVLKTHCEPDVPAVLADSTQIQQVLLNLATNAMQAIHGNPGQIDIRLETVMLDSAFAEAHPHLRALHRSHPGRTVRLAVSDNGPGMDEATLARIFEPFFTTKPVDTGTGLGLSVVHGIMQAHEGVITVDSQPGEGANFALYLPVSGVDAVTTPTGQPGAEGATVGEATAGQHILYLDDDESLVFLVTRLLKRRGYRITGCCDQREALTAIRANPAAFDLVVTDYNMPGMSGLDVAREIRTIRAELPVAVASGFIDEELRAQAGAAGVRELIFKASGAEEFCEAFVRLSSAVGTTDTDPTNDKAMTHSGVVK